MDFENPPKSGKKKATTLVISCYWYPLRTWTTPSAQFESSRPSSQAATNVEHRLHQGPNDTEAPPGTAGDELMNWMPEKNAGWISGWWIYMVIYWWVYLDGNIMVNIYMVNIGMVIYWWSGWWLSQPLWKIWVKVSWDDEIPNIWKNKKWSKPPTRYGWIFQFFAESFCESYRTDCVSNFIDSKRRHVAVHSVIHHAQIRISFWVLYPS